MTAPLHSAYMRDASAVTELPAFSHAPLLAPLLVFSLILHAAIIGFWPDAAVVISEPMTAARVAVQVRHNIEGNQHHEVKSAATAQAQTAPVTDTQQRPKQTQDSSATTRKSSRGLVATHPVAAAPAASRSDTPQAISKTSPVATAGTPTPDTTATEDGDALRKRLNGSLQRALIAHFEYPPVARRRGWEGVVQVGLRVEANGQLSRLRLVATSGHALLDRAALQSLGHVGRLPEVMDWLQGRQLDMILPVRYQLIDS